MFLTSLRCAFICLLIIYLGCSPHTALAYVSLPWQSPTLTVKVDPATQNVAPDHTFTVNVMVDGAVNLGAFQFDVIYDPAVVTVINVELGPFLGSTGRTAQPAGSNIDNVAGIVSFGAFSFGSNPGPEGKGLLATLTFTALGPGTSALNLQSVLVTDTMANAQSASVEGGAVTVTAPALTSTPTVTPSPTMSPTTMPTPTGTAIATGTAAPVTPVTPADAATATATSVTTVTPTAPPVATETATPAATVVPAPTEPSTSTPTEAATPVIATAPASTNLFTSTPIETPQPSATITTMPSPMPGAVSSRTPTFTPRPLKSPLATLTAAASSPTAALSSPLCWLSGGGIFLLIAGFIFRVLLRRYGE